MFADGFAAHPSGPYHIAGYCDELASYYEYRPQPYDGSILLFFARCRPLFHSLTPDLGWEAFVRDGFTRIIVACNHDNILNQPNVQVVAAGLDEALLRADRLRQGQEQVPA